MPPDFGF